MCLKYTLHVKCLHNVHVQESGFYCLITVLNKSKVVDALIWEGVSYIFLAEMSNAFKTIIYTFHLGNVKI